LYRTQTFMGSSPPTCPSTHTFSNIYEPFYGKKPDSETILIWLASLLK